MSRLRCSHPRRPLGALSLLLAAAGLASGPGAPSARVADGFVIEPVATGIVRPIQLALGDSGRLVVLSHGRQDTAAAEVLWLDLAGPLPIDASRSPRVVIPFPEGPRRIVFGSLAVDRRGDLCLGEENGNRVYRLAAGKRLEPVAVGLQHLVGGSSIALDGEGRLVALDFASAETQLRSEAPPPLALDSLAAESYQGPLVFRVSLPASASLPRRLDLVPPLFPRGWARPPGEPLTRFISVVPLPGGGLVLLDSLGEVLTLGAEGELRRLARLPAGHYHRTNIALGPDGSLFVSSGFHIRRIYRVSPAGGVSLVASDLGDPQGIAVDAAGRLYVAETALHRIVQIRPAS